MRRNDALVISGLILGIIALGFLREYVFVSMNEQLFALWNDKESRITGFITIIKSLSYYQLYYFKWFLTALFSGLFYGWSLLILKRLFHDYHWKELGVVYLLLIGIAIITMLIGWPFGKLNESYIIARFFMGIAQSPLPLMLMIPAIFLRAKSQP